MTKQEKAQIKRERRQARNLVYPGSFSEVREPTSHYRAVVDVTPRSKPVPRALVVASALAALGWRP